MDGFIYVTDEVLGLYVIKTYDDKEKPFDAPKKIENVGKDFKGLKSLCVFKTSSAFLERIVGLASLAGILALSFF